MINFRKKLLPAIAAASLIAYLPTVAAEYRAADIETAIQNLYSQDDGQRKSAACKISEMGPEARAAVPQLIEIVKSDESMSVRGEAANALGRIGPAAAPAVPALIDFLQNSAGGYERTYAAQALGWIGKESSKVVPVLQSALEKDSEPVVRQLAARSLGNFGPDATPALPALLQAIKHGDKELRDAATDSLGKLPPDKASVDTILSLLSDEIDSVRLAAATSLGLGGAVASPAVPGLIQLLGDKSISVRNAAAKSLGSIGASAKPALPLLKKALKDPQMYDTAFDAIENIKKN